MDKYRYLNYANDLMQNNDLGYDEYSASDSINNIFIGGGDLQNISKPSGGFPPIYLCDEDDEIDLVINDKSKKKREYKTHKTAISITEIMQRRRNVQPFI